jgi:hypothetical protein
MSMLGCHPMINSAMTLPDPGPSVMPYSVA